jgi:hypothetical protein
MKLRKNPMNLARAQHENARKITTLGKFLLLGGTTLTCFLLAATSQLAAEERDQPGDPFMVTSQVNSATPFNLALPATTTSGRRVKTVAIEFVTSDCQAAPGTSMIGVARIRARFGGNFALYALPFEAPISFSNFAEFVSARQTLIFADAGSRLDYGLSGAQPLCTVVFSGHLIPQER